VPEVVTKPLGYFLGAAATLVQSKLKAKTAETLTNMVEITCKTWVIHFREI